MTADHRAEAERMLADAREWARQAGELSPKASERACLAYAAVHALLAIHDTLTAADRYVANEAKQREAEPDPLDENDHRDRINKYGERLVRSFRGHWHTSQYDCREVCRFETDATSFTLDSWDIYSSPLTFASPAPQDPAEGVKPDPEQVELPEGWRLDNGHDLMQPGRVLPVGVVARGYRKWYAMSVTTDRLRVCDTKQQAVEFLRAEALRP